MGLSPAGTTSAAFSSQGTTSLDRLGQRVDTARDRRLEAAGLIEVERIANLRCLKANPESLVYGELRSLVEKTIGGGVFAGTVEPCMEMVEIAFSPKI